MDIIFIGWNLLDRRQTNIQKSDRRSQAYERNEKDWVKTYQVREGNCVQELDLNQRVFWINVEVYIYHDVEDDDQAEDD